MDGYTIQIWEVMGYWTIVATRLYEDDQQMPFRELLYKGEHVPIDDDDPALRLTLLLSQVCSDLEEYLRTGKPMDPRPHH